MPETQIPGAPLPPLRNIVTSRRQEESQLTDASGGYACRSPHSQVSFGNNQEGGFSDGQGSEDEESEEEGEEQLEQDDENADMDDPLNEHFTEAAYGYSFEARFKYFMAGNTITKTNRQTVELCIIAEAGMTVSQNSSSKQTELKEQICGKYAEIIKTLDTALWSSTDLRRKMYERLDGGRKDGFGERDMWKKWQQLKTHMKKMMSNLPHNYHKMKSGTQLHQVYRDVIRDHWRADYVSTCCSVCINAVY